MKELETLADRIRSLHMTARTEVDAGILFVEIGGSQYTISYDGTMYSFKRWPVGFEDGVDADLASEDDVVEMIMPDRRIPALLPRKSRLFNEYEAFTEAGNALADEVIAALKPIIDRYATIHPLRDIEVIVNSAAGCVVSEKILRVALDKSRSEESMSLGKLLRSIREEAKLTIRQLATNAGVSAKAVSDLEHDRGTDRLDDVAVALGIPMVDLEAARDAPPSDYLSDKPGLVDLLRTIRGVRPRP